MKKSSAGHSPTSTHGPRDGDMLKYKGVRKRKWGKWVSEIRLPNSRDRIWLGSYDSPIKAARAFDAAQFCLRGESANYNFPDNPPNITPTGRSMTPDEIQAVATRFANQQPLDEQEVGQECTVEISKDEDESMTSCSASSTAAHIESDVGGMDESFYNLNATLGSGNFGSDYFFLNGLDDFGPDNFGSSEPSNVSGYGFTSEDCYDTSIYQSSSLWNF